MIKRKSASLELSRQDRYSLYKRYLFWLYKNTREECDRIDRKFTQLDIDEEISSFLGSAFIGEKEMRQIGPFVLEWKDYISRKKADADKLKFSEDGDVNPAYVFMRLKLKAVEASVLKHFGRRGMEEFRRLFEESSMQRIMADQSGRT